MDYAFVDIKDVFIVIYLDDLIVYSKRVVDHLEHLSRFLRGAKNLAYPSIPRNISLG
jgi:hypothetical protein